MGHESLVDEQIVAGEDFVRDFNDYVTVDVTFWINPADSEVWFLYIASSQIDDDNFDIAYSEVLRRIGKNKNLWLDVFRIKLLSSDDLLAKEVMEIRNRYPLRIPTRYNGSSIAGLAIDGAYIYPPIVTPSAAP